MTGRPTDPTPLRDIVAMARGEGAIRRTTTRLQLDYPLFHPVIDFLTALILRGVHRTELLIDPPTHMLVDPASGSWAKAHADGDAVVVTEHGPRILEDELATVITEWISLGEPEVPDYSLTIDATGTHHLRHPEFGWTRVLR